MAGALCIVMLKRRWPDLGLQAYLHVSFDVLALTILLFSSGGAASGVGLLLVLPVAAVSVLVANRNAFLIAAVTALMVLLQQVLISAIDLAPRAELTQAGLLGLVVFLVAVAGAPLAGRLRESEALVRQRELDLANLAALSQYILERLRESIVVVDENDRVRLINESARQILGPDKAQPGALLGEISPRLLYLLAMWRQAPASPEIAAAMIVAADGARQVHPHFAPLGTSTPSPVIIFLEDTSVLSARVQQSKLAALGRLSASIAHEIRNPVGAMSHAAQLLQEAPGLAASDRRLTEIIRGNADRVSTIISNVLQLSRREETRPERLPLGEWLEDFADEFVATAELPRSRLVIEHSNADLEIRADPTQLHQVLWNLCENALKYALADPAAIIEIRAGRLTGSNRPYLEVADRGPGIDPSLADRIFEPFFVLARGGTGLGLFIARELAQCNGALLVYEPRSGGGSVFRVIFADPQRWDES
jgi:two-component system sensor histidine kinase PilS (NtrC family)